MIGEYEVVVKLVLAVIIGGIVGWEREKIHRPAGLRTHMLVSLSSALITVTAIDYFGIEAARILGGIVTGIGFLGAGTIFKQKDHVRGLTTAASLWAIAAIGIAIGTGFYVAVGVATILLIIILNLGMFEKKIFKKKTSKK